MLHLEIGYYFGWEKKWRIKKNNAKQCKTMEQNVRILILINSTLKIYNKTIMYCVHVNLSSLGLKSLVGPPNQSLMVPQFFIFNIFES